MNFARAKLKILNFFEIFLKLWQWYKLWLSPVKYSIVAESGIAQDIRDTGEIVCYVFRCMGIGADRDDFSAEFTVAEDDVLGRVRVAQTVFEAAGIDLYAFSLLNQCAQNFIDDIGILLIRIIPILVRTIADDVVNVSVDVKIHIGMQILKDRFKIFEVRFGLCAAFVVFRVIRIDAMAPMGGTESFKTCQTIVTGAQSLSEKGWKAFDDNKNRYALITDLLDGGMEPFRQMQYKYYREGLDVMSENVERGRAAITQALELLNKAHDNKSMSALPQIFTEFKRDELLNIYKGHASSQEKDIVGHMRYL